MSTTNHWATKYVGRAYEEVGLCWGFVQLVCAERMAVDMPAVAVGSREDQAAALRQVCFRRGWRKMPTGPQPDDIVVMAGPDGRHVGVAVEADGSVGLLHARYKGVCFDDWHELAGLGFHSFEYWRRA